MGYSAITDPTYRALGEDDDVNKDLAGLMSPAPAHSLVGPPPDTAPRHEIAKSTPLTGNLAAAPSQAVAKNRDLGTGYTGVSTPPDGGNVSSVVSPASMGGIRPAVRPGSAAPIMPGSVSGTSLQPSIPAGNPQQVVPDRLNMQTQQDQQKLSQLQAAPTGGRQINNRWGRIGAEILDTAGSIVAPGVAQYIPGSTLNQQRLIGRQQGVVASDQGQQTQRAQQEDIASQTNERAQKAALDLANAGKADRFDPNAARTVNTADGVFQLNPESGKYDIRVGGSPEKLQEGERPLGATIPNLNKTLQDRYQVLHPGQPLPAQYRLPATATQKDYERIDKALGGVEGAEGTHQQQQQTLALRQQALAATEAARAAGGSAALDRETARMAKPYDKANETASSQLDKIDDAANMIGGNAEAQALGIPKVLTALVGGQGTGVRITTPELNAIATARGWGGDFQGTLNSISGKGKLTSTQQQQLKQILGDVKARITQKRQIANDALDKINGGASREDVIAADKEARQRLTDLESGKTGAAKPSTAGGFDWSVHPKVNP